MLPGLGRPGDPGSLAAGEGIGYPLQYSWVSLVAQLVKNPPTIWETWAQSLGWEESPGEGKGYPLQYSGLENAMDCIVHGVTKNQSGLSKFHFTSLHPPEQGELLGESLKEKVIRRASPLKEESHGTSVSKTGMKTHLHKICSDSVDSPVQYLRTTLRFWKNREPSQKRDCNCLSASHTTVWDQPSSDSFRWP